jgi:acetyl esterase/lipase
VCDVTDDPALAEGLADYLAAVRRPPGAPLPLETARLLADRDAYRIAFPRPEGMIVANSYIVGAGSETPVRLYRPAGEGPLPAIVYLHGGGFTGCFATALAEAAGAVVVSVHYPRLPEATPRDALEASYAALLWVARMANALQIDPARIAVAGDSAGAFLATHLAVLARDRGGPALACQLLCYGVYDLDPGRPAYAEARDPVLTRALIEAVIAAYREADARSDAPLPVPLEIGDLSGLPPVVMLGAEYDAVLAEAGDYAERLRAAGVRVEARIAPGMCHGFLRAVRFSAPARGEMHWLGAAFQAQLQQG